MAAAYLIACLTKKTAIWIPVLKHIIDYFASYVTVFNFGLTAKIVFSITSVMLILQAAYMLYKAISIAYAWHLGELKNGPIYNQQVYQTTSLSLCLRANATNQTVFTKQDQKNLEREIKSQQEQTK